MQNKDGVENALENEKIFILFVLHQEFFCLKDVVVDLKVPDISNEGSWPPILLGLD